jgi:hypothetical protein
MQLLQYLNILLSLDPGIFLKIADSIWQSLPQDTVGGRSRGKGQQDGRPERKRELGWGCRGSQNEAMKKIKMGGLLLSIELWFII